MLLLQSHSLIICLLERISCGSIEVVWLFKLFLANFMEFLDPLKFIGVYFCMVILLALQLKLVLGDYLFLRFWVKWMISHCTFRCDHSIHALIVVFFLWDRGKPNFFIEPDREDIDAAIYWRTQLTCLLVVFHHSIGADVLLSIMQNLLGWFINRKHSKTARGTFLSI